MNGLERMVEMRGGINLGGFNPALLRLILWADLNCSNVLSTSPRFQALHGWDSEIYTTEASSSAPNSFAQDIIPPALKVEPPPFLAPDVSKSFTNTGPILLLPQPLSFTILELRALTHLLSPHFRQPDKIAHLDHLAYSDRVYFLQRRLMLLTHDFDFPPSTSKSASAIAPLSCIAGLIFVECILRDIAPSARIIGTLLKRLVVAIVTSMADLEGCNVEGLMKVVFWTLAVGATVSTEGNGTGSRGWFIVFLIKLRHALQLKTWEDADEVLKCVTWPEAQGVWKRGWGDVWEAVIKAEEDNDELSS
jgi:hypothetical protein